AGKSPSTEPDRPLVSGRSQSDGVAGNDVVAAGCKPRPDEDTGTSHPTHELAFVDGCRRCGPDGPLEPVGVDFDRTGACSPRDFGRLHATLSHAPP
ncbi:hypothetical protein, partial [Streptomyces sp. GbtcB7]|uniref:hypothetical protein n=1 Tax=Streptomyces sp. GbtcB7 TaxID=2824752 RepID=UPI001C2FE148